MDGVAFDDAMTGWWCLRDHGADGEGLRGGSDWCGCSGGATGCGGDGLRRVCCWGGGRSGQVEVFGADDVKAGGGGSGCGSGEGETGERGHEEGVGRFGLCGLAEEEADAGAVDASGVGCGSLGDDDAGWSGGGDVGDGAEFESEAADVDGGGALALAEDVGDGDLLCAEAFGDAHGPLTADGDAGCGRLGEDVAGGRVGGVETILEVEDQAEGAGLFGGVGEGEAG